MSSTTQAIYEALKQKYRIEFPNGTPFIVACGKGRVEDVEAMIRGASAAGEDIKAMVSQIGTDKYGNDDITPLKNAVTYEQIAIIKILLQYDANPARLDSDGQNALHTAVMYGNKKKHTIKLIIDNLKLEDINRKDKGGDTPLDHMYYDDNSPIKQQLIDLIRQKGGKRASELENQAMDVDWNNVPHLKF